jgi:hypothetical protein
LAHWVDEHRQVAPRLDPLLVHHAENRLGRRPDDEPLLEVLGATFGDPRHLGRETLDVLSLFQQEAFGNEKRKVGIDVPGVLEAVIELPLDQLPDGVAVGPDHHAALDRRVVGQFGLAHDVQVPAREVLGLGGDLLDERVSALALVVAHKLRYRLRSTI